MKVDWLIVGAGFTGCTLAERIASQLGKKVLLVDRRPHIGGNAYDHYDDHGVLVHKYGPHIFHTNSRKVWEYLSQFTEWRPYYHRVLASIEGQLVPLPFNLNAIHLLFPRRMAERLEEKLIGTYGYGTKIPILRLREEQDAELRFLADYVYKYVFEGYTLKQWGMRPEELDGSVTARVPILVSRDDRYFQDTYQAMPKYGYTRMFEKMISHPNISVLLKTDWKDIKGRIHFDFLIFTGPIDEFFDYQYGSLAYRSLRFCFNYVDDVSNAYVQPVGTVNYPNEHIFTRITEFKHLTGQNHTGSTLVVEYPEPYVLGKNEPYYPVLIKENLERYILYQQEATKLKNVIFVGRLGEYRYYNMDQAVARALKVFEEVAS